MDIATDTPSDTPAGTPADAHPITGTDPKTGFPTIGHVDGFGSRYPLFPVIHTPESAQAADRAKEILEILDRNPIPGDYGGPSTLHDLRGRTHWACMRALNPFPTDTPPAKNATTIAGARDAQESLALYLAKLKSVADFLASRAPPRL